MIRIPVHVVERLNKIGRAEHKLTTEFGREPTAEELAEVTGIEPEEVESIRRRAARGASARRRPRTGGRRREPGEHGRADPGPEHDTEAG